MDKQSSVDINSIKDMIKAREPESVLRGKIKDVVLNHVQHNCLHPIPYSYTDKLTHQQINIFLPCGHCHYCRSKYQGEWVTRMNLHTDYSAKYCYFITLTYRCFDSLQQVPDVLLDAYWRYDSYNLLKRPAYSPCILRHEHFQRFMKYLRKFHGNDPITFFMCGEYGSSLGRPHFHAILWSNEPISRNDIIKAWSCRLPKSKRTIRIGRIDYNDLNLNGTVVKIDGVNRQYSRNRCFGYVAKYLCKSFLDPNDYVDSKSRLNLFIDDVCNGHFPAFWFNVVFSSRIRKRSCLYADWADFFSDYVREKDFQELKSLHFGIDPLFDKLNDKQIRKIYYDYETSPYLYSLHYSEIADSSEVDSLVLDWLPQVRPVVFRKVFRPYCVSSRNHAIGMDYANSHIEEFANAEFNLPTIDGKKLLLPRAFVRKAQEYLARYFSYSPAYIKKSTSTNLLCDKMQFENFFSSHHNPCDCSYYNSPFFSFRDFKGSYFVDAILKSSYSFYDLRDRCRCIAYVDVDDKIYIDKFIYKRSLHKFYPYKSITFDEFILELKDSFFKYSNFKNKYNELISLNYDKLNQFISDITLFIESVFEPVSYIDGDPVFPTFDTLAYDANESNLRQLRDKYEHIQSLNPKSKNLQL